MPRPSGTRRPGPAARPGTQQISQRPALGPPPRSRNPTLDAAALAAWEANLQAREAAFASYVEGVEQRLEQFLEQRVATLSDAMDVIATAFPQGVRIGPCHPRVMQ